MRDYYQNRYMGIFFNKPEDKLIETVAENFFAKTDSPLLNVLNSNFVEGCVDEFLERQTVCLDLNDLPENQDGWTKPSRKNRRKHDKKASKRKGNAKRFRDRNRKCASWRHIEKVYNRGLTGDWDVRGRALKETGEVTVKNSHRLVRDIEIDPEAFKEEETETRTFTYLEDGFTLTMSMSKSAWEKEEEDDFSPSFNWDRKYTPEWDFAENPPTWKTPDDDDNRDWLDWEDEWENDDDEIIDEPEPKKSSQPSYDTSEFTALEMAQMNMKLACATPDQRVWIREFMKTL